MGTTFDDGRPRGAWLQAMDRQMELRASSSGPQATPPAPESPVAKRMREEWAAREKADAERKSSSRWLRTMAEQADGVTERRQGATADVEQLREVREAAQAVRGTGKSAAEIAELLNTAGAPQPLGPWDADSVTDLLTFAAAA